MRQAPLSQRIRHGSSTVGKVKPPMLASQRLKRELLAGRLRSARLVDAIVEALRAVDAAATEAGLPALLASRELVAHLWEALPEERQAYEFPTPEALVADGAWCLSGLGNPRVTLHLGWGALCFDCSLAAAWEAWPKFCSLSTDTFNAVVYPESLDWALVRSGRRLYPLRLGRSAAAELMSPA
jgi:hypothetical protein